MLFWGHVQPMSQALARVYGIRPISRISGPFLWWPTDYGWNLEDLPTRTMHR